jgi:hypothetical protein
MVTGRPKIPASVSSVRIPLLSARSADPLFSPSDLLSNQAQYPWPFSNLGTGLLAGRIAPLFSERPVSLRTSGLHRFSTVFEIQSIRVAYELHRNAVGKYRLDRREPPISKLMRQAHTLISSSCSLTRTRKNPALDRPRWSVFALPQIFPCGPQSETQRACRSNPSSVA